MSSGNDKSVFRADALRSFCEEIFVSCGMAPEDAFIVADGLVQSNLRGVDSHGVMRVGIYAKRLKMGLVNPRPEVRIVR
ncbi:MAG: Ldh family oxidoreductase, partial [Actinomycetota bacterium]|nr:Ldh family oxidoreductase [Actinomycetota bacterium]